MKIFEELWQDYVRLNSQAESIHKLFRDRGEQVVNDHVAFRTFDNQKTCIERLAPVFLDLGYTAKDEYDFPAKKLFARYYSHPDPALPRVFISQLKTREFSQSLQDTVQSIVNSIPEATLQSPQKLILARRQWPISRVTYNRLLEESEYAAWMAAFGFRANHFTVSVNALAGGYELVDINRMIRAAGIKLNPAGGEIKGSSVELLEQSSTLAAPAAVEFEEGTQEVPGCYYEFAKRYPMPSGELYDGFVAKSADKIFESTNVQRP